MTTEAEPYGNSSWLPRVRVLAVVHRDELVLTADETRAWHLWSQQRLNEDDT